MRLDMSPPKQTRGFSLVEVAIALGVVAFAVVSLVGVLPVALASYRDSMDSSLRTNVIQQIVAELSQVPFGDVTDSPSRLFDDQGIELVTGTVEERRVKAIYEARYTVLPDQILVNEPNQSLKKVKVEILTARGENQPAAATFTLFVPNNGL
jgi:uncharacterized protein (TIGR02598 family)